MEDEPIPPPEPSTRRSKRPRVPVRVAGFTRSDRIDEELGEERGESSDDFEGFRAKPKRSKPHDGAGTSRIDLTLFEVIKGEGKEIPDVVKQWVERYDKNPKSAMAELLTMLFEACGASYSLQEEFLDETSVDDIVVTLVKMAKRGEVEDFQTSKRFFKNFKDNLLYFWDNLVGECQNGPLFDQVLFDKCLDYIIALSCTPPRVYRHVASLMGLQLVTSFINVAKMLGSQRETTQRQLNAEKKKNADGPRVEPLNKRLEATHKQITLLEEMMRKIFTGLFVHRYRDVDPEIRMACIESLGVWVLSYPSLFLQDLYLKYLGWTLNDKSAGVRKASVLALQNLYDVDDNVPSLNLFTERFYKRMLELADDIDISVAVCAIGLVKQLLRHQLVPDEELGSLYDLLIDDPPDVRHAIGGLVYDVLIAQKFNDSQSRSAVSDSSEVHLSRMLQILREFSADPILCLYVIDDVWDYMGAMKDWKCIIHMLLNDSSSNELDDVDATNLIRLLLASAKKAVGEKIVPATDNRSPHHTKAQKEMFENNKLQLTAAITKTYPQLLRKYMADKDNVASLVEIIVYMDLESYSLRRQEKYFKSTLQLIREAFFKHSHKDALRSCVKAFKSCVAESKGELKDFAQIQAKELEEELIMKVKSAIRDVANGDDEYSLLVNLKRLYELQLADTISSESLYEDFVQILQRFRSIDDEVVAFLLLNMFLHVSWCLHSIASSETVMESLVSSLLLKRNALLEQLDYYLDAQLRLSGDSKRDSQLPFRVCVILAELWCLFRKAEFDLSKLKSLGYSPDPSTVERYWKFCEQLLSVSDEMEEEDGNREYVEETNRDVVMFALCKLVITDTVPKEHLAPEIISHWQIYGASVTEIVKHFLSTLKKHGNIPSLLLESLKRAYQRHLEVVSSSNDNSLLSKSFEECKDLASRLSGSYIGAARNKYRHEILNIVREGISYAFLDAPKRLSFLDAVVLNFISKLPESDIREIMEGLEKRTENINTDEDPSGWHPYFVFLETIREKCMKNEGLKGGQEGGSAKRRGRPRKNQNIGRKLFDEQSSSEEEDSISGSDHDAGIDDKQEEDEQDAPLIHTFRSSSAKLKSLRVSREDKRDQQGEPSQTTENVASRVSGSSS